MGVVWIGPRSAPQPVRASRAAERSRSRYTPPLTVSTNPGVPKPMPRNAVRKGKR